MDNFCLSQLNINNGNDCNEDIPYFLLKQIKIASELRREIIDIENDRINNSILNLCLTGK